MSKEPADQSTTPKATEKNSVGKSQWSAILDEISDLKSAGGFRDDTANATTGSNNRFDEDTLIGAPRPASIQEVLQRCLPSKLQVDRRLSRYFNSTYIVIPIVHSTQFQRQYEVFWQNPWNIDPIWAATLFAILCISASMSFAEGSETDDMHHKSFLTAAAQCLILGGYTKPKSHVIQALLLFTQCKYMASLDPSREVALILCMAIRLAFQIGLHREPDSSFSVFEGEMRRRLWAMCRHFDLIVSYQLGLPSNIPLDWHDTQLPRNLVDSDFDENASQLPSSRPETEVTRVMYFVVKTRLMAVFAQIYHQALSLQGIKSKDIGALEAESRKQYDLIPQTLRIRPMSQSFTDPDYVIMARLNCEFIYQRSMCILHRQAMVDGNNSSKGLCLHAAMTMIGHLADLYKEFLPTGQLRGARWMLSSTTMSDFLLAAVIVCLVLSRARKAHHRGLVAFDLAEWTGPIESLKEAYVICVKEETKSKSAARVGHAIAVMLLEVGIDVTKNEIAADKSGAAPVPAAQFLNSPDSHLSGPGIQQFASDTGNMGNTQGFGLDDNFNMMLDQPQHLDWTALDQYLNFASGFE